MASVDFPMEARIGAFFGTLIGGWLGGKSCHRFDKNISPNQGAIYGVTNTVSSFILRELGKWWFGDKFNQIPWQWQAIIIGAISTLITGTVANELKVQLLFSTALKITFCAVCTGILGMIIGASRAPRAQQE